MANQTLAEFTEKLFVADADHTFIWDTAASISKRVSRNSWLNSGTLTSDAPVTISQTWSTTGTYTAVKVVANETAAANTLSNVLELWSGNAATLKLSIRKSGQIVGPSGTIAAPTYGFADTDWGTGFSGWYRLGTGVACSTAGGTVSAFSITHTNIRIGASIPFGWTSGTAENALDTILLRDGANTLALRNGANAQTFNVYGTSSSSNTVYERMFMRYTAASTLAFQIGTEMVGATARPLQFSINGSKRLIFEATGVNDTQIYAAGNTARNILTLRSLDESGRYQFYINAAGKSELYVGTGVLISEAGSSYFNAGNVGIGTTSPTSKLHVAGDVTLPSGGSIFFGGGYNIYGTTTATTINGPTAFGQVAVAVNGATKWVFNYDGLLCGGGTTAAFPALKRSTTTVQARLADDTAFAPIQGKLTTDTAYTATVVAATGYITIYDSTGTAYRVPCAV